MQYLKKASRFIGSVLETIEGTPFSLGAFSLSFLALILVRLLVESAVNGFPTEPFSYHFFEFSHTFLFFLFAFLCFLPVARFAGASSWTRAANLILTGFLVIWTPPVLDKLIFGDRMSWSFYELDGITGLIGRFFTFFGDTPDIGITYGVRIEVLLMVVGLSFYAFFRSGKVSKALLAGFLAYAVFFVLGTFPSYVAIPVIAPEKGFLGVTELDVATMMLTPKAIFGADITDPRMSLSLHMSIVYALLSAAAVTLFLFRTDRKLLLSLLKNIRLPQAVWHGGLFLLGAGFAIVFDGAAFQPGFFEFSGMLLLLLAVESAWFASVVVNDLADRRIDEMTNTERPLPSGSVATDTYRTIGAILFAVSLLFAGIVSQKTMLLLLAYQAVAFLYSAPPFRLKRIPVIASFLSATAGIIILIAGFSTLDPLSDISPIPLSILVFLAITYALTLPLKDFKDIEGDRRDGVYTFPVLLGSERAKTAIGTSLFLAYAASPVVLREPALTVPAILFGSIAFLGVARAGKSDRKTASFRALPAIEMTIIVVYGFIVAAVLLA